MYSLQYCFALRLCGYALDEDHHVHIVHVHGHIYCDLPLAHYASAERYYLNGDRTLALDFARKAVKNIDKNTVEWYRTNDLIELILGIDEKDNKNRS